MSKLENITSAIESAIDDCPLRDVLSVLIGTLVLLTEELVRTNGCDAENQITIESNGYLRGITIHPSKSKGVV